MGYGVYGIGRRQVRSVWRKEKVLKVPESVLMMIGIAYVLPGVRVVDVVVRIIGFGLNIVGPRSRVNERIKFRRRFVRRAADPFE